MNWRILLAIGLSTLAISIVLYVWIRLWISRNTPITANAVASTLASGALVIILLFVGFLFVGFLHKNLEPGSLIIYILFELPLWLELLLRAAIIGTIVVIAMTYDWVAQKYFHKSRRSDV